MATNKRKSITILRYTIIGIVLIGSGAYILKLNKEKNNTETSIVAEKNSEIIVNAAQVKYEELTTEYSSNGTFAPFQKLDFPSENSGRIINVLVDEGRYVQAGQVLAIIRKDAIEVDHVNAQAVYNNAQADNQRYENAYKTGGVTKQQLDQSRLQLKNAKAMLDQSRIRVADTNIKASISGIINKKYIEPGAVVGPGTPLFEIVNVSKLKLKVTVNENQVINLKTGEPVRIKVSVFPDREFTGKITFIAPVADASLNFPVEIEVVNLSQNQLKAGMYATAVFSTTVKITPNSILVIPKEALVSGVSSSQVFVVKNNTAKLVNIVTGRIFGDKIEVLDGLKPEETVVTSGQINLIDGARLKIIK